MATLLKQPIKPNGSAIHLPGFVENGTTYESHQFWIIPGRHGYLSSLDCIVTVRHGAGWESIRCRHMIARALLTLTANGHDREAFFLCWELLQTARDARIDGDQRTARRYRQAFVDGRLKKRKARGRSEFKVWIAEVAS